MSQVGISRPITQQSMVGKLPEIQHPLSRIGTPDKLDVRGLSRSGPADRPASHVGSTFGPAPGSGRPLAQEGVISYRSPRKSALGPSPSAGRVGSRASRSQADHPEATRIDSIPEGVEVMHGDPSKTRLPLFGNRADISASRGGAESRAMSRMSNASTQQRLEIDELESLLKEKVKGNYFEIKKKFKDNDPEQKGNVSRDAFFRILVTTLGRPMNPSQFSRLTDRLGFKDRQVISFTDFFTHFRDVPSAEYPRWMDPVQRQWNDRATMTAAQVHSHLKEKAKQRVKDIADLIPQCNPDGSGHILKPEFRNVLNRMGFYMDDDEFEKLWQKYDIESCGAINGEKMMHKFGISIANGKPYSTSAPAMRESQSAEEHALGMRKHAAERQRTLDIESFLKDKFRQGCVSLKRMFEAEDPQKTGQVSHDAFLRVLSMAGLKLEKSHLAEFLSRCSVEPTRQNVPYRDFLHRFQDRSEDGMAHTVLTNPKHGYHRAESPGAKSTMSSLETQLLNMFQRDFLAMLGTFHNLDKLGEDVIPQEAFRAAIESRFNLEMTDEQFASLLDRVPLNAEGAVRYAEFMSQFDTKGKAQSLFGEVSQQKYKPVGALPRDPSPPLLPQPENEPLEIPDPPEPEELKEINRLVVQQTEADAPHFGLRRTPQELFKVIKDLLRKDYQKVEQTFYDMDTLNSRRLSQESMFQLLKRFDIEPEITRGEIRDLWKTFITNQDKTLDFLQFTRHFGYSLKSAAFPNAKVCPPRRGDGDCLIRSRKLNCAADMLQDNLRSKVDYMWEQLRQEFVAMDPYHTTFVSAEEFRDVVSELCVHLSKFELESLIKKFDLKGDGRVSYVEFLKPFALKKQHWRHGNDMLALLAHPQSELPLADIVEPPHKGLHGITAKLRQKLSGDWKNLRRAFKKLDTKNEGYLSIPEFRSVLKLANVVLDEEEVYHLLSQFDEDLSGKIPYNKFLNETFKPMAPEHVKALRKSAIM